MNTLVGIVSDTHEDVRMIIKAVKLFKERSPSMVIHCGDIISPPVLERFAGLPLRLVFGNNDGERSGLKKKCGELGFLEIDETLTFEHAGKKFFVNHGTSARVIDEAVAMQDSAQQHQYAALAIKGPADFQTRDAFVNVQSFSNFPVEVDGDHLLMDLLKGLAILALQHGMHRRILQRRDMPLYTRKARV